MSVSADNRKQITQDVLFLFFTMLTGMVFFSVLRLLLYIRNADYAKEIPAYDILVSFLMGLRFDLIVVSLGVLPLIVLLLLRTGLGKRRLVMIWLGSLMPVCIFMGVVEMDFYHEFQTRLNNIAAQYIKEDPATVASMLWHGFPVARYLLLWLVLSVLFIYAIRRIHVMTYNPQAVASRLSSRILVFCILFVVLVSGARGTFRQGPPLRWGDAYHSAYLFANHLPLNATYTFFKAMRDVRHQQNAHRWLNTLDADHALSVTRDMLLTDEDTLDTATNKPVLRTHRANKGRQGKFKNVVLIIMESFSAEFVGALGKQGNITPYFDALTEKGVLFKNFFSNGTHTHQGMFASVACFPNLPGFEYLMQQPQGQNIFSGLPVLLKPRGFNDLYVYNGEFSWDNQEGFFKNQGMTTFIGRDDFINPVFKDPTWGVSDEDMFNRAAIELDKISKQDKPFFAVLQSLSNHVPYALPEKLAFEPITGHGERLDEHLTAQKYSDWALGQFFKKVEQSDYYKDTLFVIVGDHGFGFDEQISSINMLAFHVPLLLIGGDLRQTYATVQDTVGTQVDIVPTMLGQLGEKFTHQCWGRNLLSLDKGDRGFGFIKPSGGSQTVALIEGNDILVKTSGTDMELGEYQLGPVNHFKVIHDKEKAQHMNEQLKSFVQTALSALFSNRTGATE